MKKYIFRQFLCFYFIFLFFPLVHAASPIIPTDSSLAHLKSAIKKILEETNTPAAGIALVNKEGPIWVAGLGKANFETGIDANENTLFRIGSVSKMFVALSLLKLQEEGKLSLDDKIRKWVPEVNFENKWEDTHPVRIVHLLEHTTGWDEMHLVEFAHDDPTLVSLKEALVFHPHSRISRWIPGTRKAYCNSAYAVAAYIVEKVTGKKYEAYVREHFLVPLHMHHTSFFNDKIYQQFGAVTYDKDRQIFPYRHIIYRPAGAMNSSAKDMANLVRLFLNRGSVDALPLISRELIERMEIPQSTPGAKVGLELGYGLANFTSLHNGFVYHGHNGAIDGGLTELAYLPEYGVGHVFFINASNGRAFSQISRLIREYETQALQPKVHHKELNTGKAVEFESGYYVAINPRNQWNFFVDWLIEIHKLEATENIITKSWIFPGAIEKYFPVTDSTFREEKSGKIALVKARDPLAGNVLYFENLVMKPIPGFVAFGQLFIIALWMLLMITGGFIWILVLIQNWSRKRGEALKICTYPTITSFIFLLILVLGLVGSYDTAIPLGKPGMISISLLVFSILLVLSSIWAIVTLFRLRNQSFNELIFWHMSILAYLHLIIILYLFWFGAIPIVTWA